MSKTRVFVTKYWETQGIIEERLEKALCSASSSGAPYYKRPHQLVRLGTDCFLSYGEAQAAVRQKALKRIASLKAQIARIRHVCNIESEEIS